MYKERQRDVRIQQLKKDHEENHIARMIVWGCDAEQKREVKSRKRVVLAWTAVTGRAWNEQHNNYKVDKWRKELK